MAASRWIAGFACLALAAAASPSDGAEAFQEPVRKAGCWQHTAIEGLFGKAGDGGSTYECVDAASEQARLQNGAPANSSGCTRAPTSGSAAPVAWDMICTRGAVTDRTHFEAAGDFQAAYSTTIISRVTRPGAPSQVSKVVNDSKWISSVCPTGLAPGTHLIFGGAACAADGSGN